MVDACVRDVRIALRGLRRSPGFALTAILMLAVGIGAVTMIFAEVNAVFLKVLPVGEPETSVASRGRRKRARLPDHSSFDVGFSARRCP